MVKVQLLLRVPGSFIELDADLRARIEALGMHITACGRATLSAELAPEAAAHLFGHPAPPELPVPPTLTACIASITIAPRHTHCAN